MFYLGLLGFIKLRFVLGVNFGDVLDKLEICIQEKGLDRYNKDLAGNIKREYGIPKGKVLNEGDIVNVDVTALKDGWHGDTSRMYFIGDVSTKANQLVKTTYDALIKSIKILKNDIHLGDIGSVIQKYVEKKGFSVVRDFCGHGVGKKFHEHPNILHYGEEKTGDKLKTGMIFTIEPMINEGQYETKVLNDGWTAVTKDKKLSAQFEHTVGITDNGYEIFTTSKKGFDYPPFKI